VLGHDLRNPLASMTAGTACWRRRRSRTRLETWLP
jgi:hypothetical protein